MQVEKAAVKFSTGETNRRTRGQANEIYNDATRRRTVEKAQRERQLTLRRRTCVTHMYAKYMNVGEL